MPDTKKARHVQRGDVIQVPMTPGSDPQEEVVRSVSVVLHMANGMDVIQEADQELPLITDPPVLPEG